jgi:site-specific DNA-methyltransferase (adenine-specific)
LNGSDTIDNTCITIHNKEIKLYRGDYRDCIKPRQKFDVILTSPPYNIGSKHPKCLTNRKKGGYDRKSWGSIEDYPDCMPEDTYQQSQLEFLLWCSKHIKHNGVIIYNHKPRHVNGRLIKPYKWFPSEDELVLHDEIVWDRGSTHNHTTAHTYQQSERLYILKKPGAKIYFKNQDFFWKENRNGGVGDVWKIPRESIKNSHNAPFPLNLARHCIRLWCPEDGIICDPYSGSGTTMIASVHEHRKFIGAEILPKYWEYAKKRMEELQ